MLEMLNAVQGGNALNILHINSIESMSYGATKQPKACAQIQVKKRFEINWKFLKGELTEEKKRNLLV